MLLKIISPIGIPFQGKVEKVIIPTQVGEIAVLPNHNPLSSIIKPGIVKIMPVEKINPEKMTTAIHFILEDERINIAVSQGVLYLDGENILMFVSTATTNPNTEKEDLEKMKIQLEKDIQEIKIKGSVEEIEKAYLTLQKITADLKLHKIKGN
ncbi:hypothetical protein K9M48_01450 [Candidatus Gracilibacteria bacterium]|nr:hypothetical protein [Candidatus Gracilibacteria bacterium]